MPPPSSPQPLVEELIEDSLPSAGELSLYPRNRPISEGRKKSQYPRIPKTLQNSSSDPVVRIPSVGPRKILFKLSPSGEECYEFVEKKTRSLYFDVYHCTACSRRKVSLPIPFSIRHSGIGGTQSGPDPGCPPPGRVFHDRSLLS